MYNIPAGIMVLATVFTINSCKKWTQVEPVSQYSISQVFSDVSGATAALIGVYDELQGDAGYGIRISLYFPYDTDEMIVVGNIDVGRRGIGRYQPTLGNADTRNPFTQMYRGVEKANLCIEQIPKMAAYSNGKDADKKELRRLYGEALVLRAQFLFELIRNWGDVPAPMVPAYQQSSLFIPRSNRDTVYDQLIEDLRIAEDLLPWRTEVARNERITKGAAKAMRAKLALFRGGYSLRGSKTSPGTMERRADYLKYYQIARDECADLMARRDQHTLNANFQDVWKKYVCGLTPDPAGEIMFEVGAGGGNSNSDSRQGQYNGPRVDALSRYGTGGGGLQPLPNLFYAYDSVDTRRDVTITLYSVGQPSPVKVPADYNYKTPRRLGELTDGKYRRDWRNPLLPGSGLNVGYNWVLIRFADVLLMFAEAENEINGSPTPAGIAAFEEVRKRAFLGNVGAIGVTPATKTGFFDAIVNERFLEFADEGIRKYDLIRWNLLATKIADTRLKIQQIRDAVAPYNTAALTPPLSLYWRYSATAPEEIEWYNSFYKPTPVAPTPLFNATTAPNGWRKLDWRQHLMTASVIDGLPLYLGMAEFFTPNKSELFPFDQTTLDSYQGKLDQNPGY